MKRGLALLLALVMALSMLPISAFAEETLTLEEILEETIPEETNPEEAIPVETVPEETLPEEVLEESTLDGELEDFSEKPATKNGTEKPSTKNGSESAITAPDTDTVIALSLDETYYATWTGEEEYLWFSFTAPEAMEATFLTTADRYVDEYLNPCVYLTDVQGNVLDYNDSYNADDDELNCIMHVMLAAGQTCYFAVHNRSRYTGSLPVTIMMGDHREDCGMFEDNVPELEDMTPLYLDQERVIRWTMADSEDSNYRWFYFTAKEDVAVTLLTTANSEKIDAYAYWVAENGWAYTYNEDGGKDSNSAIFVQCEAGKTYIFAVGGEVGLGVQKCDLPVVIKEGYHVYGNDEGSDIDFAYLAPDLEDMTVLERGSAYDVEFEAENQYYWFTYTAEADNEYILTSDMGTVQGNFLPYAYLLDENMELITNADTQQDGNFSLTRELLEGQTYVFAVKAKQGTGKCKVSLNGKLEVEEIRTEEIVIPENAWWSSNIEDRSGYAWYKAAEVTLVFADGSTVTGTGTSIEHDGFYYVLDWDEEDSQESSTWTAGNSYNVELRYGEIGTQTSVTVTESEIASISFEDFTLPTYSYGDWEYEWDEYGDYEYFCYYWWDMLPRTVTFTDGSIVSGAGIRNDNLDGWTLEHNGHRYEITALDEQSYETRWKTGNTYTTNAAIGNLTQSVDVSILEFSPNLERVENLRVDSFGVDWVKIKFDKVSGADRYEIRVMDFSSGMRFYSTTETSYKITGLVGGREYDVSVIAAENVEGQWQYGPPCDACTVRPYESIVDYYAKLEYTSTVYDGTPQTPALMVKRSSKSAVALEETKDYTVVYENNIDIGEATVTASGVNGYEGAVKKTFKILPDQVKNLNVEILSGSSVNISFDSVPGATEYWIYRNGELKATVTDTTYTMTGLSAGKTYKFSVKANTVVDGENYTGEVSETVSAKPIYTMEACTVQVKYATKAYTGKSVTNTFTVKNPDGKTLKKDEDYKVTYENNKNIGVATATIAGKGKYAGTLTATFEIVPPKMGTPKVKVEQLANGTALYITFKDVSQAEWFAIYLNGELYTKTGEFGHFTEYLEPGSYRVTVAAGVTIDGKDYIGAASDSVKVTARHTVANCNVVLDQTEFIYTGKSHKPVATVYGYDGEVLTEGVDYTVSYKNNKSTGKGYALIIGKGSYNGTTKAYFTINPAQVTGLKVSSTTKTSVKISYTKASSNSTKYYGVYVDGQYVGRTTSSSYTIKGLELGKTYDVYVIPEKTVSGTTYYGEASQTITVWPGTGIGGYKATLEYTTATYTAEALMPSVTVKTSSKSSATTLTQGVDYIVTYENNVGPGKAKVVIQGIGAYTGTITKTFTINPGQVTGVTATNMSKTTIQVSYDPVPGATQYWVYVGGERKVKTVDTTCTVSGLKNGKTYKITVKAVAAVDGTNYSGALSETVKITAQEPPVQKPEETDPNVMTYAEFMAAEMDTPVVVETYVQAAESWWDGHVWLYTQNEEGAYYIFEMDCTEEDAKKLIPGTKLRISGYKSAWFGEIEIIDATFEILEGHYIATATDVTALLSTDGLADHMNKLAAFKGLTVAPSTDTEGNEAAFLYRWDGSGTRGDDLYFNATNGEKTYTFNLNAYMIGTGADSAVYQTIENLQIGDVIDIEGFLYWYEEAMPHVTAVTVAE